jgi:lysophospholipase L1-like esterase
MTTLSPRLARRGALAVGCIGLAVAATMIAPAFGSSPSQMKAAKPAAQPLVVAGTRYLALGDSVPFGYREGNTIPAPTYTEIHTFNGYPEDVANNLGLTVTNAACPGETTASFINSSAQSNGCENTFSKGKKPVPGGYRTAFPLHVKYTGIGESQLTFAEKFLEAHPNTRLVTLMLGANDAFICEARTTDGCVGELPGLLKTLQKNDTTIFKGLRDVAHYMGQIAMVTYYSMDYQNTTSGNVQKAEVNALNGAMEAAAKPFNVEIANGFNQFKIAAAQGRGIPCTAQLLTALSGAAKGTCGVHPSQTGAAVLAQAVERAIRK